MNTTLLNSLQAAVQDGELLAASLANMQQLLDGTTSSLEERVIQELVDRKEWKELNDRFFKTLAFGTGGLRGKTIGNVVTSVEAGNKSPDGRPEFACIGTNCVNNYNIIRATRGLVTYVMQYHQQQKRSGKPKICISYDTRFFSREFAELTAKVITEHGCDALIFESPRSTPELSFAVRHCNATAGVNLTASHNPPAYNGYKVYFEDGGQIIEPHATSIIKLVDSMEGGEYEPLLAADQGTRVMLGEEIDKAYKERLKTLILEPSLFQQQKELKVVYTPLHGVGGVIVVPLLRELGMTCLPVESQMKPDGWFSTVKSPNPENAEALTLGIALANQKPLAELAAGDEKQGVGGAQQRSVYENTRAASTDATQLVAPAVESCKRFKADLVLATDPDDDRMGVAVRNAQGEMELLTGNQIGSLLLWYRVKQLFAKGILHDQNKNHAVVIKSLVTTELQKIIAEKSGIRCVETLTGFKYIGAKQEKYEKELPTSIQKSYRQLSEAESREARLHSSSYFVFGGEESYGYNMGDFVRDKDGNAAVLCFCEVAAYAASQNLSLIALLDQIYSEFGVYLERGESLTFEGAEGADKMKRLMESYEKNPLKKIAEIPVTSLRNFEAEDLCDSEGEVYPKEAMLMIKLEGDRQLVIRPSGTEPKIKFYLFTARRPITGKFSLEEVQQLKPMLKEELEKIWQWLKKDLEQRLKN